MIVVLWDFGRGMLWCVGDGNFPPFRYCYWWFARLFGFLFVLLCLFASGLVFPRKTRSAAPQSVFTARKGDRSTPGGFNWMTFSNAAPSFANACHPTHPDPPERLHRPPSKGDVPGWTGRCIASETQMVFAPRQQRIIFIPHRESIAKTLLGQNEYSPKCRGRSKSSRFPASVSF